MLDHHLQRTIVKSLSVADSLSFSELKPEDLDNNLFTYHLKAVIREGLVEKNNDGRYMLTNEGKKSWRRNSQSKTNTTDRARSILFLIIRDASGRWLLYKRKTHPLKDMIGFMHVFPVHTESIIETATRESADRLSLSCTYAVVGSGFFRSYRQDSLESFTNFTVLACENASGEFKPKDESADYFWIQEPDFCSPEMLPNMKLLSDSYLSGRFPFFLDESVGE